jgi:hypothetical protein
VTVGSEYTTKPYLQGEEREGQPHRMSRIAGRTQYHVYGQQLVACMGLKQAKLFRNDNNSLKLALRERNVSPKLSS